jgi:hypothetical protein
VGDAQGNNVAVIITGAKITPIALPRHSGLLVAIPRVMTN